MADLHWDSIYCRRDILKRHLDEAHTRKARIIIAGDLFDAMQGKFDPRKNMDELRPEFKVNDYYGKVTSEAVKYFAPYAGDLLLLGKGNHETAVTKNSNIDILSNLVYGLHQEYGSECIMGGYGGWIRFMFKISTIRTSIKMRYYHGTGGSAPVTKGTIQTNRQAVYLPDADVVLNGHNHNAYWLPLARERLSDKGRLYQDLIHFVRTPGYKQTWNAKEGFDIEKLPDPKPLGSVWMRMIADGGNVRLEFTPAVE